MVRVFLAAVAAALALTVPAQASTTSFSVQINAAWAGSVYGGSFVTAGGFCPDGTMTAPTYERVVDAQTFRGAAFELLGDHWNLKAWSNAPVDVWFASQTLTCSNGSGTVTIFWFGPGTPSDINTGIDGRFRVVGGTGAYAGIVGRGSAYVQSVPGALVFEFRGVFSYG